MSSIIDALKKSDQNRNSDHPADVKNIQFSDNPPPKSRRGFWLLVIVLLLVAVGVYAWQQGWHHKLLSYVAKDQTSTTAVNTKQSKQANTADKKTIAKKSDQKQPAANQLIPPKQSEIKAKTEQIRNEKLNQVAKGEELKPVGDKAEAVKPLKKNLAKSSEQNTDVVQNKPQQNLKVSDNTLKKETVTAPSDLIQATNEKKSLEPTLKQDYLLLHQVDFAIRKHIPPVKLNIHIYDPEPENRMVLINGERYNIGDSIENVLTVTDIVKEGIVVSFENVEFLIPK